MLLIRWSCDTGVASTLAQRPCFHQGALVLARCLCVQTFAEAFQEKVRTLNGRWFATFKRNFCPISLSGDQPGAKFLKLCEGFASAHKIAKAPDHTQKGHFQICVCKPTPCKTIEANRLVRFQLRQGMFQE